jgi:hypothetical protein
VASQAIIANVVFLVAVHTPVHRLINERLPWRRGKLSDIPVAFFALQLSECDVTPVREINVIRDLIDALPGNGPILVCIDQQSFFNLRLRYWIQVTVLTDLDRW